MKTTRLIFTVTILLTFNTIFAQSPGGVTGAQLWLKADAGTGTTTNGAAISTWTDQSGSGNHATGQLGIPYNFTPGVPNANFNPYIKFNQNAVGQSFTLPTGFSDYTNGLTFFSAATFLNSGTYAYGKLIDLGAPGGTDDVAIGRFGTANKIELFSSIGSSAWAGNSAPGGGSANQIVAGINQVWTLTSPVGTSGTLVIPTSVVNGNTPIVLPNSDPNGGGGFYHVPNVVSRTSNMLGSGTMSLTGSGNNNFVGNMSEVLLYNKILTAGETVRIQSYLGLKYGITLNSGAITYLASDGSTPMWTTTAGYTNRVFGIGTDNGSGLAQQASTDISTSASGTAQGVLTISTSNDFATPNNLRSAGTALANLKFITISDDGGSVTSTTTTNAPASSAALGSVSGILGRNWKLQSTNALSSTIYLQFNTANAVTGSFPALSAGQSYRLVYTTNATPDYSSNATILPLVQNGSLLTTAGITLPQNAFFTLVVLTPVAAPGTIAPSIWLKANAGITGNPVTNWVDQSASANSFTVYPGFTGPTTNTSINFNPAVTFNGSNTVLYNGGINLNRLANTASTWQTTQFVVYIPKSPLQGFLFGMTGGLASAWDYRFGTASTGGDWLVANRGTANNCVGANKPFIADLYSDYNTINGVGVNGVVQTGAVWNSFPTATGTSLLTLGSMVTGAYPTDATAAEIILYPSILSTASIQQIESYLAAKYGISINAHDYISPTTGIYFSQTANSGYTNDITVIGKETSQALDQEQSSSETAAFPVYVGAGSAIAASNSAHASSLPDNTYLAFGNNGLATTLSLAFGTQNIMPRVWKVQQTGTAGTVMIAIPVSAFTTFGNGGACVNLLTSSTSNFASGTTAQIAPNSLIQTINGIPCVTFLKDFSDGQIYFTFMQNAANYIATVVANGSSITGLTGGQSCLSPDGYTIFVNGTAKYLGIYLNGNTFSANPAITVSNNNSNAPTIDANNNVTVVSSNMYTIDNSINGSITYPNVMKVRVYFDPADTLAAWNSVNTATANPPSIVKSVWFKYEGTAAEALAAKYSLGITGAKYFKPTYGKESNGVDYAEFSNISNFSTFGYISYNSLSVLAKDLQYFKGVTQGSNNLLQWTAGEAAHLSSFKLQRSVSNNGSFATIATIAYTSTQSNYSYTDANAPVSGYYRLLLTGVDGTISYSNIIYLAVTGATQNIKVSPNPVQTGGTLNITLAGYTGTASGILYESSGRLVIKKSFYNGNNTLSTATLAKGIYHLIVTDANGNARTEKIVVQ